MAQTIRPRLRATVPDGFEIKESMTILAPDGEMNVIASGEPLVEELDAQRYAEIQGDLLEREFPDYEQLGFEPSPVFGGRPGYLRWFRWQPPDEGSVPITQAQAYYAFGRRGYTATATVPTFLLDRWRPEMEQIIASLELAGPDEEADGDGGSPHAA